MESPNPIFALQGSTNECARTNTQLLPLSEVSTGAVSLNDEGVCRTALATPGLLNIFFDIEALCTGQILA